MTAIPLSHPNNPKTIDRISSPAAPVFDPAGRVLSIQTRALYDRRVKDHHLGLLCTLADLDGRHRDGWFEVSQADIARFRRKSRTAITNAFSDLARWGYVEIEPQADGTGRRRANRYRLKFDADLEDAWARHRAPVPVNDPVNDDREDGPQGVPVTQGDHTAGSMSFPVTYQTRYVTGGDMGAFGPEKTVIGTDAPKYGVSSDVTSHIGYVIQADDSSKDLKDPEGNEGSKRGATGSNCDEVERSPAETSEEAAALVDLFLEVHRTCFGPASRPPERARLLEDAEAFAGDGLPQGLAKRIVETVFGRLVVQGQRRVNSFRVLRKTWSFIAARWRDTDRPMDPEAWEDLFDPNRFAWRDFQEAFPRPDGLRAEDTRAAFDQAARAAGGAAVVAEAARRYAARMADRDPRWLKAAGRWLAGGFWRDELDGAVVPQTDKTADAMAAKEVDASAIGTPAPDLAESWGAVVRSLARRVGAVPVAQWFGAVAIAPGARPGEVRIAAPSRFVRDEIDSRFGPLLADLFTQALGRPMTTEVKVA